MTQNSKLNGISGVTLSYFLNKLPTYPRQSARHESAPALISLITSPVTLKLNDFFILIGPVIPKTKAAHSIISEIYAIYILM